MKPLGVIALACYATHAAWHLAHHRPDDLLWACHLACVLVGVGLLASSPTLVAIGVSWLSFGLPLWAIDLATGGEFLPTSVLTHVVGFALGILGVRRLGFPRGTWWKAALAFVALWPITRALTERAANVNLAFSVHPGWERVFPVYAVYFAAIVGLATATFFGVERAFLRDPHRALDREGA